MQFLLNSISRAGSGCAPRPSARINDTRINDTEGCDLSKHHAVEEKPQSADAAWIRGLSKPTDTLPPIDSSYYGSLVARAPRHAAPADVLDDAPADVRDDAPAAARTAPLRRVSAEQVDTVIGQLDAVTWDFPHAGRQGSATAAPTEAVGTTHSSSGEAHQAVDGLALLGLAPNDHAEPVDAGEFRADMGHARHEAQADVAAEGPETITADTEMAETAETKTAETANTGTADPETVGTETVPPAGGRHARSHLRKPILLGAAVTLCVLTLGGVTIGATSGGNTADGAVAADAGASKTVSIVVDGQRQQIDTQALSVAGVLAAAGLHVTAHDTLAPALDSPVAARSTIVLDRGRQVTLTIDGKPRQIWTTARTVDQALAALGADRSTLLLSANRSRAIPLDGLVLTATSLRTVALTVGGRSTGSSTTGAKTVAQLLAERTVVLGPLDRVTPAAATPLRDGLVVAVDRIEVTTRSKNVRLGEPPAKKINDPKIDKGTSTVVQKGRPGQQVITYKVTTVNGRQAAPAESSRRTVIAPVATVTHVGTRTGFTYVGNEVFTNDTTFGVNWDGLAMCESTHNPKAVNANPSAGLPTYGLFQFDIPTWATVGGSGNPMDHTPEEQLMRAKMLYQSRGLEPWACRDSAH